MLPLISRPPLSWLVTHKEYKWTQPPITVTNTTVDGLPRTASNASLSILYVPRLTCSYLRSWTLLEKLPTVQLLKRLTCSGDMNATVPSDSDVTLQTMSVSFPLISITTLVFFQCNTTISIAEAVYSRHIGIPHISRWCKLVSLLSLLCPGK
jgi:hypothetical protein